MGTVIYVGFQPPEPELSLTKQELGNRLGYSKRHIEKLTAEGMPSEVEGITRLYKLSTCVLWLLETERAPKREEHFRQLLEEAGRESGRGRQAEPPPSGDRTGPGPISA